VNIIAVTLRIILLPFLPPQTAYACSLVISWWFLAMVLNYFYPKISMIGPDNFPYIELEANLRVLG
jgi:hypothetical protein